MNKQHAAETTLRLSTGIELKGFMEGTEQANGLIVFIHGSGSSRFSSRNNQVAHFLRTRGFATLLMDLLTTSEDQADASPASCDSTSRCSPGVSAARSTG